MPGPTVQQTVGIRCGDSDKSGISCLIGTTSMSQGRSWEDWRVTWHKSVDALAPIAFAGRKRPGVGGGYARDTAAASNWRSYLSTRARIENFGVRLSSLACV